MHRISVEHDERSRAAVVIASGELDAYTEADLESSLEAVALGQPHVVFDLTAVSFLDSTALRVLVRAVRDVGDAGGRARVVLPTSTARRIFEITTLDEALPVSRSRADALRELAG